MSQKNVLVRSASTPGDIAVNGMIGGIPGGVLMAAYLALAGWLSGEGAAVMLGRFDPTSDGRVMIGLLAHLAMSAVLGMGYSLLLSLVARRWALSGWLSGLVYGLALWVFASLVLLPATGSPLQQVPAIHFAVAHVFYGVTLGGPLARQSPA